MTPDRAIEWMAEHGHPGYADSVNELHNLKNEVKGEAGRYWMHCEYTQRILAQIDAQIADTKQAALDRYEDWATD